MKKVISFIASHYRNDKIWLRRTLPSKRDYKILIAIDDSLSMRENNQGFFSLEAMIALTEALNRLEVGKVAVARIRDRMELVHSFDDTYTSQKAGFMVSQFNFEHQAPNSADYAMANFVSDANKLLDLQNAGNSLAVNCPFVIVLSDGRLNKNNVRRYIREAKEKRYLYIFVILDKPNGKAAQTPAAAQGVKSQPQLQSILKMKSAVKD